MRFLVKQCYKTRKTFHDIYIFSTSYSLLVILSSAHALHPSGTSRQADSPLLDSGARSITRWVVHCSLQRKQIIPQRRQHQSASDS